MNIVLWVIQAALAFLYLAGGGFKIFKPDALAGHFRGLSPNVWRALGLIEVVGGVLLVLPAKVTGMPALTGMVAAVLAVETLGIAAAYGAKSVKFVAANPFPWNLIMGLLVAFVAWGRYAS
jgi:VIT1/CCC1 family predicted Fe2+/Mn2+ transporter